MTESVQTGLWILLAMVVVVIAVAALAKARQSGDEEAGDLEHFDHEPGDPSTR